MTLSLEIEVPSRILKCVATVIGDRESSVRGVVYNRNLLYATSMHSLVGRDIACRRRWSEETLSATICFGDTDNSTPLCCKIGYLLLGHLEPLCEGPR